MGFGKTIAFKEDAFAAAVELLSEDADNPEYDRAIAEFLTELFYQVPGVPFDTMTECVAAALRETKGNER